MHHKGENLAFIAAICKVCVVGKCIKLFVGLGNTRLYICMLSYTCTTYSHNNNIGLRKTLRCVKLLKNFISFYSFSGILSKGNCSASFSFRFRLDYYLNVRIN